MSRNPYCPKCGVVDHVHSPVYCVRVEDLLVKGERLLERVQSLREELAEANARLGEANAIIANTAATVQAFRSKSIRTKTQRDLALFLGLRFSPGIFHANTEAAKMFDRFQELRAEILKEEGYHPGWLCPVLEENPVT